MQKQKKKLKLLKILKKWQNWVFFSILVTIYIVSLLLMIYLTNRFSSRSETILVISSLFLALIFLFFVFNWRKDTNLAYRLKWKEDFFSFKKEKTETYNKLDDELRLLSTYQKLEAQKLKNNDQKAKAFWWKKINYRFMIGFFGFFVFLVEIISLIIYLHNF